MATPALHSEGPFTPQHATNSEGWTSGNKLAIEGYKTNGFDVRLAEWIRILEREYFYPHHPFSELQTAEFKVQYTR